MNIINIYFFNTNSNSLKSNLKIFLEIILQIISKLCQNLVEKHINIFITYQIPNMESKRQFAYNKSS